MRYMYKEKSKRDTYHILEVRFMPLDFRTMEKKWVPQSLCGMHYFSEANQQYQPNMQHKTDTPPAGRELCGICAKAIRIYAATDERRLL